MKYFSSKLKKIGCFSAFVFLLWFLFVFSFLVFKKELPKLLDSTSATNPSQSSADSRVDPVKNPFWTKFKTYLADLKTFNIPNIEVSQSTFFSISHLLKIDNPNSTNYNDLSSLQKRILKRLKGFKNWEIGAKKEIGAAKIWLKFRTYLPNLEKYEIDFIQLSWKKFSLTDFKQIVNPDSINYGDLNYRDKIELRTIFFFKEDQKIDWEALLQNKILAKIWPKFRTYLSDLTTYNIDSFTIDGDSFSLAGLKAVNDPNNSSYQKLGSDSQRELKVLANKIWEPALQDTIATKIWTQLKAYLPDLTTYLIDEIVVDDTPFSLADFKIIPNLNTATYDGLNPTMKTKLKELISKTWESALQDAIAAKIWIQFRFYFSALTTYNLASFSIDDDVFSFAALKAVDDPNNNPYQNLGDSAKRELQALVNQTWKSALEDAIAAKIWIQFKPYLSDLTTYVIDEIVVDSEDFSLTTLKAVLNPDTTSYDGLGPSVQAKLKELIGKPWEAILQDAIATKIWTQLKPYLVDLTTYAITGFSIDDNLFSLLASKAVNDPNNVSYQDLGDDPQTELKALVNKVWKPALEDVIAAKIWTQLKPYLSDLTTYVVDEILIDNNNFSLTVFKEILNSGATNYDDLQPLVKIKLKELIGKNWKPVLEDAIAIKWPVEKIWTKLKSYLVDLTTYDIESITIGDVSFSLTVFKKVLNPDSTAYNGLKSSVKEKLNILVGKIWEPTLQDLIAAKIWIQLRTYLPDLTTYNLASFPIDGNPFSLLAAKAVADPNNTPYQNLEDDSQKELKALVNKVWKSALEDAIAAQIWIQLKPYLADLANYEIDEITIDSNNFSLTVFKEVLNPSAVTYPSLKPLVKTKLKEFINKAWKSSLEDAIATRIWAYLKFYLLDLTTYNLDSFLIDGDSFSLLALKAVTDPDDTPYQDLKDDAKEELKALVNKPWESTLEEALAVKIWIQLRTYLPDLTTYLIDEITVDSNNFSLLIFQEVPNSSATPYLSLKPLVKAKLKELVAKPWEPALKEAIAAKIWIQLKPYFPAIRTVDYSIVFFFIDGKRFYLRTFGEINDLNNPPPYQDLGDGWKQQLKALINKAWEPALKEIIKATKANVIWNKLKIYFSDLITYAIDEIIVDGNNFSLLALKAVPNPGATTYHSLNPPIKTKLKELVDKTWESALKEAIATKIWTKFKTYLPALQTYQIDRISVAGSSFALALFETVVNPSETLYLGLGTAVQNQLQKLIAKDWVVAFETVLVQKIWNDLKENYGAAISFYEMASLKLEEEVEFPLTEIEQEYENLASNSPTKAKLPTLLAYDWKAILETTIMEQIWDDLQWYLPDLKTYKITSLTIGEENIEFHLLLQNVFAEYGDLNSETKQKLKKLLNKDWSSALKTALATAIWKQLKPYLPALKTHNIENFVGEGEIFSLTALKTVAQPETTSYESLGDGPQTELQALINIAWEPALKLIINTKLSGEKIWLEIKKNYFLALKNAQITSLAIGEKSFSLVNLLALSSDPLPEYSGLGAKSKEELSNLEGKNWEEAIKAALAKKVWDKIKTTYLSDLITYQIDNLLIGEDDFSVRALKKVLNPDSLSYEKLSEDAQRELQAFINKVWEPGLQTILAQPIWNQFKSYLSDLKKYQIDQVIINDAPFPFAPFLQDPNVVNLDFFQLTDGELQWKIKTLIGQNWETTFQTILASQIWLQFRSSYLSALKTYQMDGFQIEEVNFAFFALKAVLNPATTSYGELEKAAQTELKFLIKKEWEPLLETALAQAIWNKFKTYLLTLKIYQIDYITLDDSRFSLFALKKAGSASLADYFSLKEDLQTQLKELISQDWELALQMVIAPLIWTKFQTTYLSLLKTYNITSLTIGAQVFSLGALKAVVNPADLTYLTLNQASKAEIEALVNQAWESVLKMAIAKQFSEELIWEAIKRDYFAALKTYQISELNLAGTRVALTSLLSLESDALLQYSALSKNAQKELTSLRGKNWKEAIELALTQKFWTKISSTYLADLQFYDLVSLVIDQKPVQLTVLTQFSSDSNYQALSQLAKRELFTLIGWDWEAVFQKEIAHQIWEEIKRDYLFAIQKYDLKGESYIDPVLSYQELEEDFQTVLIQKFIGKGPAWRKLFQEAIAPSLWNELKEAYLPLLKTTAIIALSTSAANLSLVSLKSEEPTTSYGELSQASKKELVALMVIGWEPLLLAKLSASLPVEAIWARIQMNYLPDLKTYQITELTVGDKQINLTAFFALVETAYSDLKPALQTELLQLVGENWETVFQTALARQFWSKIQANNYLAELEFYRLTESDFLISFEKINRLASLTTPYSDLKLSIQWILKKMIGTAWEQNIQLAQTFLREIYQPIWKKLQTYLEDMATYGLTSLVIAQKTLSFQNLLALSKPFLPYSDLSLEVRNQLLPLVQIVWEPLLQAALNSHKKGFAIWEKVKTNYLAGLKKYQITSLTFDEEQIDFRIISEVEGASLSYSRLKQAVQSQLQKLDGKGWEKELQLALAWKQLHPYLKQLSARKITEVKELKINSLTSQRAVTNYQALPQASKTVFQTLIKKPNWEKQVQNLLKPASSPTSSSASSSSSGSKTVAIILSSLGGGIALLLLAFFLGYKYFWKKRKPKAV